MRNHSQNYISDNEEADCQQFLTVKSFIVVHFQKSALKIRAD